jgi:pimeloyl-ACP methyl ester carboxylesterase
MAEDLPVTLATWRQTGQIHRYRGRSIFYQTAGAGPALLCIHGFPTASWDWHAIWPALSARFSVIAPDMLGFGYSDKPVEHAYSIFDQASLHEDLLRALGVRRVHVLAHDYGDTVAQELLARHEARLEQGDDSLTLASVCLLNGGLFPEAHRPRLVQRLLASRAGRFVGPLLGERAFRASLTAIFGEATPPSDAVLSAFWSLFSHNDGARVVHLLIGYMAERKQHRARWVGALERTRVPLRVINGSADPISGAHMVARYRELVPDADVVELRGIGHYPQVEDPEGVTRAFMAFQDRLSQALKAGA